MPPPRKLIKPCFEEKRCSSMSAFPESYHALPLGRPDDMEPGAWGEETQALQLFTNGDVLVGRADSGEILSLSGDKDRVL